MAKQLLGKEVNEALVASLKNRTAALQEKGITATLGIIRLGENPSDLSYEKGATKRAEEVGVAVKNYILPENATKEEVLAMREIVLEGMDLNEIDRLTENIKVANHTMEEAYLYDDLFAMSLALMGIIFS